MIGVITGVRDGWIVTKRNLYRYIRLPQLIIFSSIQPIMFLTLFNFVFGGALGASLASGDKYINYLLPGILVQTILFGSLQTGVGLSRDLNAGIIDRFRSLPMSRSAVLTGRTNADMVRNITTALILLVMGFVYGFRFHNGAGDAVLMIVIIIAFGYAFSWVAAFVGLAVKDEETAQLAGFLFIFPLTFASATFVPTQTMPEWLQKFANNQPVTFAVTAARHFATGSPSDGAELKLLAWIIGLIIVFVPLSIYIYKKRG
jgi:ABC-2 type transport system permease protein/oleandomycin transport system permease protein